MSKTFKEMVEHDACMIPLKEIHEDLGMNCHAWDTLGRPFLPAMWGNTLCKAIKGAHAGLMTCAGSHKEITKEAKATGKPAMKKCHAGLIKAVVPVFLKGRYVGMIGGCGGVPTGDKLDETYLRELAERIGVSVDEMLASVDTVSEVDVAELECKVAEALAGIECASGSE
jgi:ligand-binding sensor protein